MVVKLEVTIETVETHLIIVAISITLKEAVSLRVRRGCAAEVEDITLRALTEEVVSVVKVLSETFVVLDITVACERLTGGDRFTVKIKSCSSFIVEGLIV